MTEKKDVYQHESRTTGFGSAPENAETEHRETATEAGTARNEIDVEERNREKDYPRRTRQDTKLDPMPGES